jgi:hypothetical protein
MIGPVSGTGRAMLASLQQAVQKGMPPDQAVQYVKSMATQGVAPLADLYAMMNQFQRLKQQQVQPPQTPPTIRDQLNIMDQQQQMQGIQRMQAPPPAGQPMDRGLGAIDAGRMQYPQFAGGGIVAFQGGAFGEEIDFTKMSVEQLEMLAKGENPDLARAALRERVRRSGYPTPGEFFERLGYTPEYFQSFAKPPAAFKLDSRKFPSYMYDEKGDVRQGEVTGGIAGTKLFTSSRGAPSATPAPVASQSAVPTAPIIAPSQAGSAFDTAIGRARENVRQDQVPAAVARSRTERGGAPAGGAKDPFAELITAERGRKFEEIPDTFSGEEKKRIEKAIGSLSKDKQDAVRMALAQAGFGMAAAASRAGRQRTTTLGALAEGAIGGLQQYNATQKELKQTERELNKEMGLLRRYQDEVARGERTAKRAFEEKRSDNIADLTARSEQLKQNQAELAQRMKIAGMELEERRLERGERRAERGETLDYRERQLQVEALKEDLDGALEDLKSARTIGTDAQIAAAEARVTQARADLMRAARVTSSAPTYTGPVPREGFKVTPIG